MTERKKGQSKGSGIWERKDHDDEERGAIKTDLDEHNCEGNPDDGLQIPRTHASQLK